MRTQLYSIYDTVAAVFNKPFTEHNDESAKRSFQAAAGKQPHISDYSLYNIGEFDDSNGTILTVEPVKIMSGLDIKVPISSITPEMQAEDLEKFKKQA